MPARRPTRVTMALTITEWEYDDIEKRDSFKPSGTITFRHGHMTFELDYMIPVGITVNEVIDDRWATIRLRWRHNPQIDPKSWDITSRDLNLARVSHHLRKKKLLYNKVVMMCIRQEDTTAEDYQWKL